ncbi:MAG: AsmA family protein [Proteobacteria bacterium]|nr:AsmA family protein [Pseudomonadota bacterium]
MKRAWKILAVIAVLLVAVVVAGVVVLKSIDFNEYRGLIAEQVKAATGRDLTIAGDLRLDISLTPAVAVEGVTFANAPWGSRPEMVTLRRLEVQVELLPLLTGDVRVTRVVLIGLDALLETDAKGRGNWEFAAPEEAAGKAAEEGGEAALLPVVHEVRIRDLKIVYRDGRTGRRTVFGLDSLEASAEGLDSPLHLALKGAYNGAPFEATGRFGSVNRMIEGRPLPVFVEAKAFGAFVRVEGDIGQPREVTGLNMTVSVRGEELALTLEAVRAQVPALKDIEVPAVGPYSLSARIRGSAEKLSVSDIDVSVGRAGLVLVKVTGAVADAVQATGLNVTVSVRGEELARAVEAVRAQVPALKDIEVPAVGPYSLSARFRGSAEKLSVSDIDVSVGRAGLVLVKVTGAVADAVQATGLNVTISVRGEELARAVEAVRAQVPALKDIEVPPVGPYSLSARFKGSAEKLSVSDIDVSVGRAEQVLVKATGTVADAVRATGLDLRVAIESQDLSPLIEAAGVTLPKVPAFRIAGRLTGGGGGYAVDDLTAKFGASDLAGRVAVSLGGQRPRIEARLSSKQIDLEELLPPAAKEPPAGTEKGKTETENGKEGGAPRLFSADPLPLDGLKAADAKLAFRAERVKVRGLVLSDVALDVALNDGRLVIKPLTVTVADGRVSGDITLDARGAIPRLAVNLDARKVDLGRLLKDMEITDVLESRLDATVNLKGGGTSVRAIMAGLDGDILATLGEGRINNKAVDLVGADLLTEVFTSLNPLATKDDYTRLTCAVVRMAIRNGVATADKGIAVETKKMNVIGSGTVNLKTEKLDLAVRPRPKEGLGISLGGLAGLVRIKGTLAEPRVGIDEMGVVKTGAAVGAALATGGLSLIAQGLFDKATEGAPPCQVALGTVSPATASTAPAQQPAPPPAAKTEEKGVIETLTKGVSEGIGGVVKGVGGVLEGLFGGKKE